MTDDDAPHSRLEEHLKYLKLPFIRDHYQAVATQAAKKHWAHVDYLEKLADGEAALRRDRSTQRRIRLARFPVIKTLDQFNWSWPKKINRLQVKNLFRLQFVADKSNVIFLGGVGLGKTHLRATFRYGVRQGLIANDPTDGLSFFPVEKRAKYVPAAADLDKVIAWPILILRTIYGSSGKPWQGSAKSTG